MPHPLQGRSVEQYRAPLFIAWQLTNRCRARCVTCCEESGPDRAWRDELTRDEALRLARAIVEMGIPYAAFGGGEPLAFRGFDELVRRLWAETPLAVSLTTNGLLLTRERVRALAGAFGQLRLSLYDDNDWRARVAMLADEGVRFGVNWLVTPARLAELDRA